MGTGKNTKKQDALREIKDEKPFKGLCKVQFIAQRPSIESRLAEGYNLKKIWKDLKAMQLFTGCYNTFRLHHGNLIRDKSTSRKESPPASHTESLLLNIETQQSNQEETIDETDRRPAPASTKKEPITASTVKQSTTIKADATRAANIPKDQLY